jgi:hypothetical protein
MRSVRRFQPQARRGLLLPGNRLIRLTPSNTPLQCLLLSWSHRHVDPGYPARETLDWPGAQARSSQGGQVCLVSSEAAPRPILPLRQAGPQGSPLHIATDSEEMLVRLDGDDLNRP